MFSYILFDLDGTVSDPREGITTSVQYALRSFGIEEPDKKKLEPFIGPPLRDSFMRFYGFTPEQAEAAVAKYRERFSVTGKFENELYPGMKQMLAELQAAGAHLAIASSKPAVFVEDILAYFGIRQYFEVVVGSELDGTREKKEEVVQEALRRFGLNEYSRVAMVGDRKFDVEGAKAIGAHSVGVTYGFAGPGELQAAGAEIIVDDVAGLRRALLGYAPEPAGGAGRQGVFSGGKGNVRRPEGREKESAARRAVKAVWVSALAMGLYFVITLSVSTVLMIVGIVVQNMGNFGRFAGISLYVDDLWLNLGNTLGIAAAFGACFGIWHSQVPLRARGPVDRVSLLPMGILAASLSVGMNGLLSLAELYRYSPTFQEVSEMQLSVPVWLGVLTYGVLAPLGEEFLFRGIVYGQLRRAGGPAAAIVISAVAFGLFHGNLVQFVYATTLGIVMALVREIYGTLWASVAFHAIANLFVYLVLDLTPVGGAFVSAPATFFFLLMSAVCLIFMVKWQKNAAS